MTAREEMIELLYESIDARIELKEYDKVWEGIVE